MMDEKRDWGEFSEWLERINACIEAEQALHRMASESETGPDEWKEILASVLGWMQRYEEAPITTWAQELWVRGYDFGSVDDLSHAEVSSQLWQLLDALAGMRVFITNTDHLSDRQLFDRLVLEHLTLPVAQIVNDAHSCCVVDIVGAEVHEDPSAWLTYYASNRERMEWAKQNIGKPLPPTCKPLWVRDILLPRP
jgi:hypothetical protein